jgi:hypothetical protein
VLTIVSEMSYFSSLGHMMLLFLIRYLITVHPLQSRIHLTALVVTLWSITVWIMSLILSLCEARMVTNVFLSNQREHKREIMTWYWNSVSLIRALFPFFTIITLHCLKMKSLRSSHIRLKDKNRMNLIITTVLGIFLTFQIIDIVLSSISLLSSYGNVRHTIFIRKCMIHLKDIRNLMIFVHLSCNPYIYFIISYCFRAN